MINEEDAFQKAWMDPSVKLKTKKEIEMSERERRLDAIREYAGRLAGIADGYDRLRWMAEMETTSDAFIVLAEAAGMLTVDSLQQLSNLLEILRSTEVKNTIIKGN